MTKPVIDAFTTGKELAKIDCPDCDRKGLHRPNTLIGYGVIDHVVCRYCRKRFKNSNLTKRLKP